MVTVQLPVFNELHVVERLLESVAGLDYPREKLHVQLLDDSTDETREIGRAACGRLAEEGFDVEYVHREERTGFKAGGAGERDAHSEGRAALHPGRGLRAGAGRSPEDGALFHGRAGRDDPDALGAPEPDLQPSDAGAGDVPGRAPRAGADGAEPERAVLHLQRHRRDVAEVVHRGRGRLGARHPDRGHGPELPGAAQGLGSSSSSTTW